MSSLVDVFQLNPVASVFGTVGLLGQLVWPLFRQRKAIMSVQFGIAANYSLHYALMDAWSGAGMASLGAIQSATAFLAGDRPWLRRVSFVLLPVAVAICYTTWHGLPSILALATLSLIMIGRMQRDTLHVRILLLMAAPFGMAHDILLGATPALIGGVVSAVVAITMLRREIRERRWAPSSRPGPLEVEPEPSLCG